MLRDELGRLQLAVVVYGAWSTTLDHDLRWFETLPPRFAWKRRRIEWREVWFSHLQCLLPASERLAEPVQLHVSAMTGTLCSDALEEHLLAHADGVVFAAERARLRIEATREYRERLERWIRAHPDAPVVFQLDENLAHDNPPVWLPIAELAETLDVGTRPCLASKAVEMRDVGPVFREIVMLLVAAERRGALVERPLLAPVEPLATPM